MDGQISLTRRRRKKSYTCKLSISPQQDERLLALSDSHRCVWSLPLAVLGFCLLTSDWSSAAGNAGEMCYCQEVLALLQEANGPLDIPQTASSSPEQGKLVPGTARARETAGLREAVRKRCAHLYLVYRRLRSLRWSLLFRGEESESGL